MKYEGTIPEGGVVIPIKVNNAKCWFKIPFLG